jgi:ribonuclease E
VLEEARKKIAAEEAAAANAQANLRWVATHPELADVDKGALYNEAVAGITLEDVPAAEPEKPAEEAPAPKRKRRTKAEIAADKAREEAEKAAADEAAETRIEEAAAYTSVEPASPAPVAEPEAAFDPFGQGAQVAPAQPVGSPEVGGPPAAVQGAPTPPPAAVAGGADPFDPFGTGA